MLTLPGRSHGARRMGQRRLFQCVGTVSGPRPRRTAPSARSPRRRSARLLEDSFAARLPAAPTDGPPSTFDDLKSRAQICHRGLNEFAASLKPRNMSQAVRIPWFPDPPCVITVGEAMVQVAMHSQHHRGQCMTRLKDFGGEPKNVDWIIWLWKQKPAARWS